MRRAKGFSLIELLMAMAIASILIGVCYFGLVGALESWDYTRDQLALQKVLSSLLEEILDGTDQHYGLRSALEIYRGWGTEIVIVPPYTQKDKVVGNVRTFQLEKYPRPGSGLPTAEYKIPETGLYRTFEVSWLDSESQDTRPWVRTLYELPAGAEIRFSYYPDPDVNSELRVTFRYDPENETVLLEEGGKYTDLGDNFFGVKITDCRFRYYDNANNLIRKAGNLLNSELGVVTAVEVELKGKIAGHEMTLVGMVSLRNSPMKSGMVILRKGMKIPIADSKKIKTFLISNVVGVSRDDEIQLVAEPPTGKGWLVNLRFEKTAADRAVIGEIRLEYPPGHPLYTERPELPPDQGVDLLTVGPNGLFDYDDDPLVEDSVIVEGEPVTLTVNKMDVKGAAVFVKP